LALVLPSALLVLLLVLPLVSSEMLVFEELLSSPGCSSAWYVFFDPRVSTLPTALQILILIFAEVLGLYGLIVALIMNSKAGEMKVGLCLDFQATNG
jgi:hypothetical protein